MQKAFSFHVDLNTIPILVGYQQHTHHTSISMCVDYNEEQKKGKKKKMPAKKYIKISPDQRQIVSCKNECIVSLAELSIVCLSYFGIEFIFLFSSSSSCSVVWLPSYYSIQEHISTMFMGIILLTSLKEKRHKTKEKSHTNLREYGSDGNSIMKTFWLEVAKVSH